MTEASSQTDNLEEWRDLPPDLKVSNYEISRFGHVRNKKTLHMLKPVMRGEIPSAVILITDEKKSFATTVARLVGYTFIPNPQNYSFIKHINNDLSDYRAENLFWSRESKNNDGKPYKYVA